MNANELRIGNLLSFNNLIEPERTIKVDARFFSSFAGGRSQEDIDNNLEINGYYRPIPLTEYWLLKFGYKEETHSDDLNIDRIFRDGFDYFIVISDGKYYLAETHCCYDYNTIGNEIKYIHQLQNLYFALTGKELPI